MSNWLRQILDKLSVFEPYIYKESVTTDSVYVRFHKIPHSLRIGGHTGKRKYRYRWNLRTDMMLQQSTTSKGLIMHFYPIEQLQTMVSDMRKIYEI